MCRAWLCIRAVPAVELWSFWRGTPNSGRVWCGGVAAKAYGRCGSGVIDLECLLAIIILACPPVGQHGSLVLVYDKKGCAYLLAVVSGVGTGFFLRPFVLLLTTVITLGGLKIWVFVTGRIPWVPSIPPITPSNVFWHGPATPFPCCMR